MRYDGLSTLTDEKLLDAQSRGFARYVGCLSMSRYSPQLAAQQYAERWPNDISTTILKTWPWERRAAVPGHGVADTGLVPTPLASAFATFAAPYALITRFGSDGVPPLVRTPFDVRTFFGDPDALSASFSWVRSGQAKPAVSVSVGPPLTLRRAKASGIAVTTRELIRMVAPGSDAFVRALMAGAVGRALDRLLIDPAVAATDTTPASFTNTGVAVGTSSGSATDDLRALLAAYVAQGGAIASAVILISSANAAALALSQSFPQLTAHGGIIAGLPALASDAVADLLIVVDTSRVALADNGEISLDSSEHTALEMTTTPTQSIGDGSPLAPVPAELVSMWQSDSVAVRIERLINWQAQADAVAYLTGADYLVSGSPA